MTGFGRPVVVVTGAAAGIGAAIASTLAPDARALALWDQAAGVHRVARELGGATEASVLADEIDVTDGAVVSKAFDRLISEFGPAHVVVHAAGIMLPSTALDTSIEDWAHSLAVNATGTMNVAQRAARDMVATGYGSIVVVSSNAATTPRVGMAAYSASKAAATAFTRALALQVAPYGVRVNLVSPGSTDTAMLRGLHATREPVGIDVGNPPLSDSALTTLIEGDPDSYRLGIPLRRIATPTDIAAAVRFLVSNDARHITMHDLRVDGGASLDM
ncbi:2,3-dihydro-2,3-dihydroxybenzoate dehydrogenase (plasmid) [Rhodococcus sp. 2G]|uniref:SDR family oxidoreductase n=1 Tax=Rhodococcus sp. 2G TaxID=1570939 RepID=UPI0009043A0F|nr:SDR family oxidoreductase [Rhodococcus sp. 2G]APE12604.1 2,3-dihydro-2,3-dihydroxybenzoate dehydrogenase [Rhodococcus sp. 2G]